MPTINKNYQNVRSYTDTLTDALQQAQECITPTMGNIGMNFPTKKSWLLTKLLSEGEWERVQRMRLEGDDLIKGGQCVNPEEIIIEGL